jgi:hypothetical protein
VGELNPDVIERGLVEYVAEHYDERRLAAFIRAAIATYPDQERVARFLRRGASPLIRPRPADGLVEAILAYTEIAETLAIDGAPARGSDERGAVLVLGAVPASALASVPQG